MLPNFYIRLFIMVRTIVKPTKRNLTIKLPEIRLVKWLKFLTFEVNDETMGRRKRLTKKSSVEQLKKELAEFSFNSGGYKFDRDEANNYGVRLLLTLIYFYTDG